MRRSTSPFGGRDAPLRRDTTCGKALQTSYADFRCALAAGFFAAASFAGFFPEIGMSISFCPGVAFLGFLGFLAAFFEA